MLRLFSLVILALIALLAIAFAILNASSVSLNYFVGCVQVPLALLLLGVFILGTFFGYLITLVRVLGLKLENRRLRHKE